MNDMYLRISLTMARLDFEGEAARLDIRQPAARVEILRQKGQTTVQAEHPKLEIDGEGAHAAEGRRAVTEMTFDAARQGIEDARQAAVQYNAQGESVIDGLARGKLARANAARVHFEPSAGGIGYMPYELPHIGFTDNVFHYSREPDRLVYNWTTHPSPAYQTTGETRLNVRLASAGGVQAELMRLDARA